MDQWLRDTLSIISIHGPIVALVAGGAVVLACIIALARRLHLQRQERLWLEHRLFVPKRVGLIRTLPRLPMRRERRHHPRRSGNPVSVVFYDDTDTRPIGEGRVVDRSLGGVCIVSSSRLEIGSKLQIRPLTQRNQLPGVSIEVRSTQPDPMAWRMGCRFLKRPSWSVLMHLR